jgi:intergrase/recombinase
MNLINIYQIFYPKATKYTFFSVTHGTVYKVDIKQILTKKKTEITSQILSDYNGIKLEINNKRNYRKYSKAWRLNNSLSNDQCVIEEIREGLKKY